MFPDTVAQWHAALNDFPSILLLMAIGFEFAGAVTKRESLRAAGFWTLMVGAAGAVLALWSGLSAEETIEHGGSMHLVMERHETMGIWITVILVGLAAWRVVRRTTMAGLESKAFYTVAALGAAFMMWTAHVGGTIVFEYGGGIPSTVLEGALQERTMEHSHAEGEEHDDDPASQEDETAGQSDDAETTEHEHD
jgi:uncharacterized membrane protein